MKRGEIYLVEIKEYRSDGLMVFLKETNQTLLLSAGEIKDGIKQKHKKMIGWFIPVRIKSLRPLAISNMRLDKSKLRRMGLNDAKPILKANSSNGTIQPKETEKEAVSVESSKKEVCKKVDVKAKSIPSGFMVWWKKIDEAALYTIKLFINQDEIDVITKERNTSYHSFVNMARIHKDSDYGPATGLNYYVTISAENREGKIVATSELITVSV